MIFPCILSGGVGTRLWPLSRQDRPKQFLPLFNGRSLFQMTVDRVQGDAFARPIVIGNQNHRFLLGEQLQEMGVEADTILLEPIGRNTAAPAAMAAMIAEERDPEALVLLLPSDHMIKQVDVFQDAIRAAETAANEGQIVTFGINPSEPNTGYGYIRLAPSQTQVRPVEAFVEKPNRETAETFLAEGNYVWNAGIFLYSAKAMLAAFELHQPQMMTQLRAALATRSQDLDFTRIDEDMFAKVEDVSIDYAIMEKAENIACVPMAPQWDDLGSWSAIWSVLDKDERGNSGLGDSRFLNSENCLAYAGDGLVSVIGLSDVLVISTRDSVLVAHKDHAQDVKKIVEALNKEGRTETQFHPRSYKPWGYTERINAGDRFAVQSMMIKPGMKLSLQSHLHRAEHWVVVSGTLEITINDEVRLLTENQSAYVPLGARHTLHNPGRIPVRMIEVQSGTYLADDDIIRYEDQ
ncbi:mannose-1-phosphate guanylyltransferase/mannose-1-phosphate guanylyltransferase/mannose-6-phosphate isomerase [Roseibium hamelinense]|uniref:mannose-1-phosphate guanylyltransferase n=1 Tax=Roseibium hamelinense TaxID=150831 RepID=A0A562TIC9_9HYPH|nr:mannose-1-phosphate guanylyltransferase/mannose-6-phosphate isomerase [Roseibium hamelinense]MTI42782.1 mannose-1-phosphate guanylyltransferase/mannose-6-phosphate isomerase [Roseibium hamelinense]TWI93431.1 mannose-1-phosphate guanylyltransferase/mannose-1-phosphate guanylyltransferase/mannose-6-phosphate isomerase [Roseibium hamelinense]